MHGPVTQLGDLFVVQGDMKGEVSLRSLSMFTLRWNFSLAMGTFRRDREISAPTISFRKPKVFGLFG